MRDTASVWSHVTETLQGVGFRHLIYLTVDRSFQNPVLLTTLPDLYEAGDPARDPFLTHCCQSYDITLTGPAYLRDYAYLPDSAKVFIRLARAQGFETGLGIPMRLQGSERFGGFNIGTGLERPEFEARLLPQAEELRSFCLLAHRRLEEVQTARHESPEPAEGRTRLIAPETAALAILSPREREVAYLVASGYSRKESARLCALSPNTVSDYIKAIYRKLGIRNRAELAALAHMAAPSPDTPLFSRSLK